MSRQLRMLVNLCRLNMLIILPSEEICCQHECTEENSVNAENVEIVLFDEIHEESDADQ